MNTALTWQRIRARIAGAAPAHDESLRHVGIRLAAQTVGLLLVMLLVLEIVVYVVAGQTLKGGLEDTLKSRANQWDPAACHALQLPCGGPGPGGGPGGPGRGQAGQPQRPFPQAGFARPPASNANIGPSDASNVYVTPKLKIVHGDGALGTVLLAPQDARNAIRARKAQCCSVQQYQDEDYLVYTKPLLVNGAVHGAVQTSVSEHQYLRTMDYLRLILFLVAILGLMISGAISVILVRRALQPIRLAMQRQRDFVADAAHELRTPLAIMRTVGEIGMAEQSVDELQSTLAQMLGESQHLTRLVDDLSLLARTDTNAISIDRRPVDLSSLVSETAAEIVPLADSQGIQLGAEVAPHIGGQGDLLRLRQLLLILLDNALKHTPSGGQVTVRLSARGDRARLEVRDSGPGIDPADLPRIFDRFYRADRSRTGEGSGLGLAIAKWIVEAHHGHIQAANASSHGAVFTVTLPAVRAAVAS